VFRVPVVCLTTAEGAALGAALHGAWIDQLINRKSVNLPDLLSPVVKPDESSRALPNPASADQYQEVYTRFKGLTQRLASGGYL
jgi:xylulokinase